MSIGKLHRSDASLNADLSEEGETRSGLWWSVAEFATLAGVALAAGLIIFYVRWPADSARTVVAKSAAAISPSTLHAPVAADRVVLESATNDDLKRFENDGRVRELLIEDSKITDEGLVHLKSLTNLEHLKIRGAAITDKGIATICEFKKLRYLNLPQADFTNAGLAQLATLPQLEMLRFGSARVTDEGLAECAAMSRLRFLHLINVPVTDEGLEELHSVTQLESLYLDGAKVTDGGLARLLSSHPDLHVHVDQRHLDRDLRATSHAQFVP